MDKKRGMLNIGVSLFFKVILVVSSLYVRRLLIRYIGNDANGLNSLYGSIIGFLSVAELGIGGAITFSMYQPVVDGEEEKVAALYRLYRKLYAWVGAFIFAAGTLVMFFLPRLARDYSDINANVYFTYFLTLVSVVLTYSYSAKNSLLVAHKFDYISTTITSCGRLIEDILKIFVILCTRSYQAYIICRIISVLIQWLTINRFVSKKFPAIITTNAKIDDESRKKIVANIRAMFMHKIGTLLVNTADSVIISSFIGVIVLGKYSNYTTIMNSMIGILGLCFSSMTSVVAHAFVHSDKDTMKDYFYFFYGVNYVLGVFFSYGYYAVINNVIAFMFGEELILARSVSFVVTVNYFLQFMRHSTLMFRSCTGTFYYDRWKPLGEGIANIIFSILLVKKIGVVGVIAATIGTCLLINDIVEPYVVFRYGLNRKVKPFLILNYSAFAIFLAGLFVVNFSTDASALGLRAFLLNGFTAVGISLVPILLMFLVNQPFRAIVLRYTKKIAGR